MQTQQQPFLFFELALVAPPIKTTPGNGGRSVVDKLLKVRRELTEAGKTDFLTQINHCIEEIRSFSRVSDSQLEALVLFALERQGCITLSEIAQETRAAPEKIKAVLKTLHEKKLIRQFQRHIPNSDRKYFGYKSNREFVPEAG